MRPLQLEFANPRDWLIRLGSEADGFRRLVTESGGTARAAYRIARARCSASHGGEPCLEDLQAAAASIAKRIGSNSQLPITSLLPPPRSTPPSAPAPSLASASATVSAAPPAPSSLRKQAHSGSKSRPRASRVSL